MIDYTGIRCPVCDVPFKRNDDIVVCPACGAPYHRHCYQKEGHCIYEAEHASGKVWKAPEPPKAPDVTAEIKDKECPACGTLNGKSALFCNRCGASLIGEPEQHSNRHVSSHQSPFETPPSATAFGGSVSPFAFDPMGGVSPTQPLDDDVSFGEASKLVKQNTMYYLPVFRFMKQFKRNKFNFCAFLFSGGWLLYRKQYKLGAILTALMFLLYIGYLWASMYVTLPIANALYEQAGVDFASGAAITSDQQARFNDLLLQNPDQAALACLPLLFLTGMLVVMIITGIKGNRLYMNHCIKTVRAIKGTAGPSDVNAELEQKGGVNLPIAICMFVCYSILVNVPRLLLLQ